MEEVVTVYQSFNPNIFALLHQLYNAVSFCHLCLHHHVEIYCMFNQAETYFKHSEFRRSFKGGQRGRIFFQKAANKEDFVIRLHDVKVSWGVTTYPVYIL